MKGILVLILALRHAISVNITTSTKTNTNDDYNYYYDYYDYPDINPANISNSSSNIAAKFENYDDDVSKAIFKNYNKLVRPVEKVKVKVKISLRQIVSFDERNQIMTSNIYFMAIWEDYRLKWNPSYNSNGTYFGNLTEIYVPATNLWLPDFFVINSAGTNGYVTISSSNLALVGCKGQISLVVSVSSLQTRCKMDFLYFPFDSQNCSIIVGSWNLDTSRIEYDPTVKKIDLNSYLPHQLWFMHSWTVYSIFSQDRSFGRANYSNEDLVFSFKLRRGYSYYMANIVACYILNFVTLLAFNFPFPSQVALCFTIFLTFAVQAVNMSNYLPIQSTYFPLISIYFICSISLTAVSLIWFYFANKFSTSNDMPIVLQKIAVVVKSCLFFYFSKEQEKNVDESGKAKEPAENDALTEIGVIKLVEKCNNCDVCSKCKDEKKNDEKKKKKKTEIESLVLALNILALVLVSLATILLHIIIWSILSNSN